MFCFPNVSVLSQLQKQKMATIRNKYCQDCHNKATERGKGLTWHLFSCSSEGQKFKSKNIEHQRRWCPTRLLSLSHLAIFFLCPHTVYALHMCGQVPSSYLDSCPIGSRLTQPIYRYSSSSRFNFPKCGCLCKLSFYAVCPCYIQYPHPVNHLVAISLNRSTVALFFTRF